jgi:3-methyladenine DNA glycosylase/8-oxoguanine DNA glycosylase
LARRFAGLRMPRTARVVEHLYPTVLAQKVTSVEAARSYRCLVQALGTPAPGPVDLLVPPAPAAVARLRYDAFHPWGIERKRADTLRRVAAEAPLLDADLATDPSGTRVRARLLAIPGIGPWTVGEVAQVALGDADAVVVGDYHLPHQVAYAFCGQRRSDDDTMLALLAPFAGQRGRVQRMIVAAGLGPPRRAPRARIRSFASY